MAPAASLLMLIPAVSAWCARPPSLSHPLTPAPTASRVRPSRGSLRMASPVLFASPARTTVSTLVLVSVSHQGGERRRGSGSGQSDCDRLCGLRHHFELSNAFEIWFPLTLQTRAMVRRSRSVSCCPRTRIRADASQGLATQTPISLSRHGTGRMTTASQSLAVVSLGSHSHRPSSDCTRVAREGRY